MNTIAQAVTSILLKPEETANKFLAVYSVITSQNQMLQTLQGLQPDGGEWKVTKVTSKEILQKGLDALHGGDPAGFGDILSADFLEEGSPVGLLKQDGQYDNQLLELPREDLSTILSGILQAF